MTCQPWEAERELQPSNMAAPTTILLKASDGASDYANKFGEPLLAGFARSNGFRETVVGGKGGKEENEAAQEDAWHAKGDGRAVSGESVGVETINLGERREWLRPIMFSAGVGFVDEGHTQKVSRGLTSLT